MAGNVELAKTTYEALARGDGATVLAQFTDDIEWHEAEGNPLQADDQTWVGPQAIAENLFSRLGDDFDGFRVDVESYTATEDGVLVICRYGGTVKATGKKLDGIQVAHHWKIRDGKFCYFHQYMDTAKMQRAMGK